MTSLHQLLPIDPIFCNWIIMIPKVCLNLLLLLLWELSSVQGNRCCRMPDPETLDCSSCHLEQIPSLHFANITTLRLDDNLLACIEPFAFTNLTELRHLSFRNNPLETLYNESFVGLQRLEDLDMRERKRFEYVHIPPDAFAPLLSLKSIKVDICQGSCKTPIPAIQGLSPQLEFLQVRVESYGFVFGQEFSHLKQVQTLVLGGRHCHLGIISNDTFRVFSSSLTTLEVTCGVASLEVGFMRDFRKLRTLNVACNYELSVESVLQAIRQMPSASLEILVADGVNSGNQMLTLKREWFDSDKFENITHLSLRHTRIVDVDMDSFLYLPNLEFLNFGYNTVMKWESSNISKLISLLNKRNITAVDISFAGHPYGGTSNFRKKYCTGAELYSDDFFRKAPSVIKVPDPLPRYDHSFVPAKERHLFFQNIPQSLLFFYASNLGFLKNDINKLSCNVDNNVLFIDISQTQISRFNEPLIGAYQLQGFDLSGCRIRYITPAFLDFLPSLTYLNLSENELSSTDFGRLFANASSLETLDLRSNRLKEIPRNIFQGLLSIKTVLLSNNPIEAVSIHLHNNTELSTLDLRNTSLTLPAEFLKEIDTLQSRVKHRIELRLQGNIFSCDCKGLDFLKWLQVTAVDVVDKESLYCYRKNETILISEVDVNHLENTCAEQSNLLTILLTPIGIVSLAIFLVILVHNYKWTLRWKFYLLRRAIHYNRLQRRGDGLIPLVDDYTTYHAFVSYHHGDDYPWVQDSLVPILEDEWGLKLCVGQRDFIAGIPIAENICNAIDHSRYVILVITPSFVSSEWCDFEMHMALVKGRHHLIMIYKEEVDTDSMSRTLRALLTTVNYIEFCETPAGSALFWQRLKDKLTSHVDMIDT